MRIAAVSDGYFQTPPEQFLAEADWRAHADMLGPDGLVRLPVGGFLVQTGERTILVDAGFGRCANEPFDSAFRCGGLPGALGALGVAPEASDTVVCTHLHRDHTGWLVAEGEPFFPNAAIRFGAADWDALIKAEDAPFVGAELRAGMLRLEQAGRLQPIDRDGESLAPGLTARAAPGHTPGHQILVLASGEERLAILGDAVTCPLQITEADLEIASDMDPKLARRTRETVLRELEGALVTGPHFPGLELGRLMAGTGRRYFAGRAGDSSSTREKGEA